MYDEETDSYISPETLFLRSPHPNTADKYQPSFDKPEQLRSNKEINGYLNTFSQMYYQIFHGSNGELHPDSIYALGEYKVDIPKLYQQITENLLTTFGSLSTAEQKRHFLFKFVENMIENNSQELYHVMIGKDKLNKLTKHWMSNILTSLINSQATSESPARGQILKIRTEILQEIIKSIENPFRFQSATNNPGVEDICSNQTQKYSNALRLLN
jgi:hypothetical protein